MSDRERKNAFSEKIGKNVNSGINPYSEMKKKVELQKQTMIRKKNESRLNELFGYEGKDEPPTPSER